MAGRQAQGPWKPSPLLMAVCPWPDHSTSLFTEPVIHWALPGSAAAHGHPEPGALPSGPSHRRGRRLRGLPEATAELVLEPHAAFTVTRPKAGGERSGKAAPGLMGAGLESSESQGQEDLGRGDLGWWTPHTGL